MGLKNYQDFYGLYHDREVGPTGLPSSNNGWIYTAYARALNLPVDMKHLKIVRDDCIKSMYPMHIDRLPGLPTPPLSKDEVIGLVSLGLLKDKDLKKNHYQFYNVSKPKPWFLLHPFKILTALFYLNGKHRNTVWQEEVTDVYPVAFRLLPDHVYFVKRSYGSCYNPFLIAVFWLSALITTYTGKDERQTWSSRNILWLQLKDLGYTKNFVYKKLEDSRVERMTKYFGQDHVFLRPRVVQ